MKRVYVSHSPLQVAHMRNLLELEGIRCRTRHMGLVGGAGELPPTAIWPELWVERALDADRAERIIRDAERPLPGGDAWTCPVCGELLEPQFDACWRCAARDDTRK